jgi:branched-subunit amino acid transport protein
MNDPLDDLLDARFRDETSYIDDAGFTALVMEELPARPRSFQAQRSLVILTAAIVSVIVAYYASGEGMFIQQGLARLSLLTPLQLLAAVLICGSAMLASGLWAALSRARDPIA